MSAARRAAHASDDRQCVVAEADQRLLVGGRDRALTAGRASCPALAGGLEAGVGLVAQRREARRQRVAPLLGLGELLAGLGADVGERAADVKLGRARAVEGSCAAGLVDLRPPEGEVGRVERAGVALGIDPIVVGAHAAQERARLADGQLVLLLALLRTDDGVQQDVHAGRVALRHRPRRLGGAPAACAVRHPLPGEQHVVLRRDVRRRLVGLLRWLALQQLAHGPVADRGVQRAQRVGQRPRAGGGGSAPARRLVTLDRLPLGSHRASVSGR